jgi:hypothetical protein
MARRAVVTASSRIPVISVTSSANCVPPRRVAWATSAGNVSFKRYAPAIAPMSCAAIFTAPSMGFVRRVIMKAVVIAGLKCADTLARAAMMPASVMAYATPAASSGA